MPLSILYCDTVMEALHNTEVSCLLCLQLEMALQYAVFNKVVLLNSAEVKFSAVPYLDTYRIVTLLVIHSPSVHYCVCALGWVKCREQILNMDHHTCPNVTSLYLKTTEAKALLCCTAVLGNAGKMMLLSDSLICSPLCSAHML